MTTDTPTPTTTGQEPDTRKRPWLISGIIITCIFALVFTGYLIRIPFLVTLVRYNVEKHGLDVQRIDDWPKRWLDEVAGPEVWGDLLAHDEDPRMRLLSVHYLGKSLNWEEEVVPMLLVGLKDDDESVCKNVLSAMGLTKWAAQPRWVPQSRLLDCIQALDELAANKNRSDSLRTAAVDALQIIRAAYPDLKPLSP